MAGMEVGEEDMNEGEEAEVEQDVAESEGGVINGGGLLELKAAGLLTQYAETGGKNLPCPLLPVWCCRTLVLRLFCTFGCPTSWLRNLSLLSPLRRGFGCTVYAGLNTCAQLDIPQVDFA